MLDRVGDDGVDTDRSEQQRHRAKDREQQCLETLQISSIIPAAIGTCELVIFRQNIIMTLASHWHVPVRSILIALGFFLLGGLSDFWLRERAASWSITLMHDALIGIGAGLLVLLYERRQRRNLIRKLEVIRLMNHHVRNSLQVISFAASDPKRDELATELRNAVSRIEWALQEVLPGQREDIENLLFQPTSQQLLTRDSKTA